MRLSKNEKFNFGLYKGYDVGIIYLFDSRYIEWCIENIDDFCIVDLDELLKYNIFNNYTAIEGKRGIGIPNIVVGIDIFETFDDLVSNIGNQIKIDNKLKGKYKTVFKPETLQLNRERIG